MKLSNVVPEDQRVRATDTEMLGDIIEVVEEELDAQDLELDPDKKAQLIILLYEKFMDRGKREIEKEDVIKFLKLAS